MWDFCQLKIRTARKNYPCEAWHWINNSMSIGDLTPEEQKVVEKARAEGFTIPAGTKYKHCWGIWEGCWTSFRCRIDLDEVCLKYGLYEE